MTVMEPPLAPEGPARDTVGAYDLAWQVGGALCLLAGGLSLMVRREPVLAVTAR